MRSIADGEQFQIRRQMMKLLMKLKVVLIKYEIGTFNKNNTLNK
jgi:propionyl-CoA synthetase